MDESLQQLRRLAEAGGKVAPVRWGLVSTGHAGVDGALGGGLPRGQLHELFAGASPDSASAIGLAAILARQLGGAPLWLREERAEQRLRLHGPGLAELGLAPGRLLLGILPDADAVLRAAVDVLRCPDVGVAVIELWNDPRNLGLTATRRFQLAAEASGVTALLLRVAGTPLPSAAATRFQVRAIAGRPLAANAPGLPAFGLELLRRRGGGQGQWRLEWDRESGRFHDLGPRAEARYPGNGAAALSGAVLPATADRPPPHVLPWRKAG